MAAIADQKRYNLVDDRIIESVRNCHMVMGSVTKEPRGPLMVEDQIWEIRYDNLYANVVYDSHESIFKAWYNPFIVDHVMATTPPSDYELTPYKPDENREMGLCYATSTDGLNWEKPSLGVVAFGGGTDNNLVMRRVHGVGVRKDEDGDSVAPYLAFMQGGAATSDDGIHWKAHACKSVEAAGDTHNNAFYDPRTRQYTGYTRLWDGGQRVVGRTTSPDFIQWEKAEPVMQALLDEPHCQTYTLVVWPAGGAYWGLVMIFDTDEDTVDTELAWSADGVDWRRICPGQSLIPRGDEESFDNSCVYAAAYPVEHEGKVWLYYGGSDGLHSGWRKGAMGLAYMSPGSFAGRGVVRSSEPAIVETSAVLCDGRRLCVTADANEGGGCEGGGVGCYQ